MRGYLSFEYEEFEDDELNETITTDTIEYIANKIPNIPFNYYVIDDSGKIVYQGSINKNEK